MPGGRGQGGRGVAWVWLAVQVRGPFCAGDQAVAAGGGGSSQPYLVRGALGVAPATR